MVATARDFDKTLREMANQPNQMQADYWNGIGGTQWVNRKERFDSQLGTFIPLIVDSLELRPNDAVLDIGCGTGALTRALADKVPDGSALGLDISEAMIEDALASRGERTNLDFQIADIQTASHPGIAPRAIASRFGVMFFSQPTKAFENLASWAAPEAELCFVCWQSPQLNPWIGLPGELAEPFIGAPPALEPGQPSPFAFADPNLIASILSTSGWTEQAIHAVKTHLYIGGPGSLDQTVEFVLGGTSLAIGMREADPESVAKATDAVHAGLAPYHDGIGVRMDCAIWLVRATKAG
jgi:ubiquinone/menaquinone biosynthesis C-methylase UbiE